MDSIKNLCIKFVGNVAATGRRTENIIVIINVTIFFVFNVKVGEILLSYLCFWITKKNI